MLALVGVKCASYVPYQVIILQGLFLVNPKALDPKALVHKNGVGQGDQDADVSAVHGARPGGAAAQVPGGLRGVRQHREGAEQGCCGRLHGAPGPGRSAPRSQQARHKTSQPLEVLLRYGFYPGKENFTCLQHP